MRCSPMPLVSLATLMVLVLGACGSSGDGLDLFSGGTVTVYASANRTLFQDGTADPGTDGLRMGDTAANVPMRIGLRFTLVSPLVLVPTADEVESVTLQLRQTSVTGAPYVAFGAAVVDRVDFGVSLGAGDFAPTTLTGSVAMITSDGSPGILQADVTAAVVAALRAGSLTSDLLVRFPTSLADGAAQFAEFERAAADGKGPVLLIKRR